LLWYQVLHFLVKNTKISSPPNALKNKEKAIIADGLSGLTVIAAQIFNNL
jgi:hypothetical protein